MHIIMDNIKLQSLRQLMKERNISSYYLPVSDYHSSEYIGDYFKTLRYITGFTGSAAVAVVTLDKAALWTDGRYFIQGEKELAGSGFTLMKMGQPETPTVEEFISQNTPENGVVGFDGRIMPTQTAFAFKSKLAHKNITFHSHEDLIHQIWTEGPSLSCNPIWQIDDELAGESVSQKVARIRSEMAKTGATIHLVTTLDETAWLFNLRGSDIASTPLFMSYGVITADKVMLFTQLPATEYVQDKIKADGVILCDYNEIDSYITNLTGEKILLETKKVNFTLYNLINSSNTIIDAPNPIALTKAVKNPTEILNMRDTHIRDGVAVTKFIYWVKENIGKIPMTELSVADKLEDFRREQMGFLSPSFVTISAYQENGALCHYRATKDSYKELSPKNLLLIDSGGQYVGGTTDITRTIALGELTPREKQFFTITANSMLKIGDVKFPQGCTGLNLDYAIRGDMWKMGLNYNHGTGHGVGYMSTVHERPNGLRWKVVPEREDSAVWQPGMICSVEPGIYLEDELGVRIENLVLCVEAETNSFGTFLEFEHLTYAPIDLEAIDREYMTADDIQRLNSYHKEVYEKISPYLNPQESQWLKEATREI